MTREREKKGIVQATNKEPFRPPFNDYLNILYIFGWFGYVEAITTDFLMEIDQKPFKII